MWYFSPKKLFAFIVLLGLFGASVRVAYDPDLFWHLKTGEYILANGIPYEDPSFSFSAIDREWVTHEWLSDVFLIAVYNNWGGLQGLSITFAFIIMLTFGILFWASDGRPYLAGGATFWGIAASLPFLNARPQMFNLMFGAIIILIMEQVRRGRWSTRWVWVFPLIFLAWVNMHGGFLLGFVVIGVYVVGETIQLWFTGEREGGLTWGQIKTTSYAAIAGVAVSNINPNTTRMWSYAFETLTSDAMRNTITEWQSPNFHLWVFWLFGFMVMATFFVMVYSKRPVLWTDALFIAGTMFAGLQSVRNIPLFAMVAIPVLSRHLVGLFVDTPNYALLSGEGEVEIVNPTMNRLNWVLALVLVIATGIFSVQQLAKTDETIAQNFPVQAVDWLQAEGLDQARIFNDYSWGGYLIWREVPVFIDGRADLYGDDFIYFYMQTYTRQPDWREPLDSYEIEYILTQTEGGLRVVLDEAAEWTIIYADEVSTIYGRS